jgi:adenine-specific DNA-methyltransferase
MTIDEIIKKSNSFDQKDKNSIKNSGVVFTDKSICNKIIEKLNPKIDDIICEPSVGKGVFVFSLLEYFRKNHSILELLNFVNNNLHCYDINNEFLTEFKSLLINYFEYFNCNEKLNFNNIKNDDFLLQNKKYDIIIGNPPYIRIQNIDKKYLNELKNELKSISLGNIDMYYAFIEKSLLYSNKIGFIIPNSFIKNKSGFFIRDIIKDRLKYIYDFKNEKVWNNISTYTAIIICENEISNTIQYETKNLKIEKDKSELSNITWIFENINNNGNNKLIDMINYHSNGLATLKDDVFKMDYCDDLFCYKNGFKIEKNICKKYIKATTDRKFDDYKYIIYPYKNGKIIDETDLKNNYKFCYQYLLSRKEDLIKRDKGKIEKYDAWYAYGRKQGLLKDKKGDCIILPLTFLKSRNIHFIEIDDAEECLVLSGIYVDVKKDMKQDFLKIISSDEFYKFCELNNKILPDGSDGLWLSLNTGCLKNYRY